MKFPFLTPAQWLNVLRIAVGLMLAAHGVIRMYVGTVDDFGGYLNQKGFMIGVPIAWGITLFEIIAGITLSAGYFRKWITAIFIIELTMGIIMVHAPLGWFVVGHTSGGMEYSFLLILCLLTVASTGKK